jgi:hypothetical protein
MFDLEALIALVLELRRAREHTLTEFEYLLYEAACNRLVKELKGEGLEDDS